MTAALSLGASAPAALAHTAELEAVEALTDTVGERVLAAAADQADAAPRATPAADCGPGSRPAPGMQGRVSGEAAEAGRAEGFTCNVELLSHQGRAGGFKVHRFVDRAGRECAYYDSTLLFPMNAQHPSELPTGTVVLDMSKPSKPVRTTSLQTPAMQSPHESLVLNERRGLLVAVWGNPSAHPGVVDVYDVNEDCRNPVLQSSLPVGVLGHESGFAPDGNTFYATSLFTGNVTAVDMRDPKAPVPLWTGNYRSHGLTISEDGNRAYLADLSGLIILDVSEIQARKLNPQVREVSRLGWETLTIPQVAIPVTIGGRPYLVEVDEYSTEKGSSIPVPNGQRVGAARIIDISDERAPRVVSDIRLAVHQPENRAALRNDPGTGNPAQGYAGHYCEVPRRAEPGIVACSFIASGLRIFDIRDPSKPKEIAYFVAPMTHSSTGSASNYAMSAPAFVPARGEVWYSDGNTGFYALRVTNGVWPGAGAAAPPTRARACLSRRAPIGPRNIGRVRIGYSRGRLRRRVAPAAVRRGRRVHHWCVKRSRGRVSAVFSGASARGGVRLVTTTGPRHVLRTIGRGARVGRLHRRFPAARRLGRGLLRAGPRSARVFGTRGGRVRYVAVASRRLLGRPRQLRRYLRRAGL